MSRVRSLRKIGGNRIENKTQEYTKTALEPFIKAPLLGGLLLKNVSLASGSTLVNHGLGRKPEGWIVVRKRANIDVWDDQDNNVNQTTTLKLEASGAVVVDLWIF